MTMNTTIKHENMEIINQVSLERELSQNTKNLYTIALNSYSTFLGKTLNELLEEAETEEDNGIRWKRRTVKKHLIEYRNFLFGKYIKSTAKMYMTIVKTFYKHFEIELQKLPSVSEKNLKENPPVQFEDIPTKNIIKECCNIASPVMKAILLFMSSSGCARRETLNLTIVDFIEATKDYHTSKNIYGVLEELHSQKTVVPIFHLRRQKTNKYYYTFCSPEAVKAIIQYLSTINKPLHETDKLFSIDERTFSRKFVDLNTSLEYGKRGTHYKFTSHMLRKYHATTLNNLPYFKNSEINFLQGRVPEQITGIYLQQDPRILREKYIQCLNKLQVFWDSTSITIESDEYKKVVNENNNLKREYTDNLLKLEKVEKLLSMKSDEEWLDLLNKI